MIAPCGCNALGVDGTTLLLPDAVFPAAPDAYVPPMRPLSVFTGAPQTLTSAACDISYLDP